MRPLDCASSSSSKRKFFFFPLLSFPFSFFSKVEKVEELEREREESDFRSPPLTSISLSPLPHFPKASEAERKEEKKRKREKMYKNGRKNGKEIEGGRREKLTPVFPFPPLFSSFRGREEEIKGILKSEEGLFLFSFSGEIRFGGRMRASDIRETKRSQKLPLSYVDSFSKRIRVQSVPSFIFPHSIHGKGKQFIPIFSLLFQTQKTIPPPPHFPPF